MDINQLMNFIQMGNNPQQFAQTLMQQNPQLNAMVNQMKQSGMTPKQFVMQYAKQNNVNIQPMIDALKGRGINF